MKQERAADAAQIQTPFPPRFSPYRRKCNNFSPSVLQLLASDASFLIFEAGPNVAPHDSFTLPYPWHSFSSSDYLSPSLHSSETQKRSSGRVESSLRPPSSPPPPPSVPLSPPSFRLHALPLPHTPPLSLSWGEKHSFIQTRCTRWRRRRLHTHVYGGRTTYGERGELMKIMLTIPLQN